VLLAVDVGNTSTHFGVFEGNKLLQELRVPTNRLSGYRNIRKRLSGYRNIRRVMVTSVVPWADKIIRRWWPEAIFIDHKNIGIKIKLKKPSEIGSDRLVDALAAYKLYKSSCIVVDFGTATTFDLVSAKGEYLGGAIAPGILLARDSLYEGTAKLPRVEIKAPRRIIGKNTSEAMQSGLVFGYVALVEGMVERIKSRVTGRGSRIKVVATGGLAKLICKYTKVVDRIDLNLTLKGLQIVGDYIERRIK
jgi:type III pantothenate kinase